MLVETAGTVNTGDARGDVRLWRANEGPLLMKKMQPGAVADAAFSSDGRWLATAGRDGAAIWSIPDGHVVRLGSPGGVSRVAFSPDGSLVATAGQDGVARLWDTATGARRRALRVSKVPLTDVVFSPDGRVLLTTGFAPRNVVTWDTRTGRLLNVLVGHSGTVSDGAFSPDGKWIVTAGAISAVLWLRDAVSSRAATWSSKSHSSFERG